MDVEERLNLIKEVGEEVINEEELRELLKNKDHPVAYDGFEPSGVAPIHFGLLRAANLKKMINAGFKFKLFLADYFGMINNKLGGNLKDIQTAGRYFVEVWKACGIDTSKVEIVWASENMDDINYWNKVLNIAKQISFNRTKKSLTIAGRTSTEDITTAQLFYPSMQVADIFHLEVDVCQMGMDQRRANMLGRDVAEKLGWKKPVAIHHPILTGLQGKQEKNTEEETMMASKMSKSDPNSCIYMHDTYEELKQKISKAYCPEGVVEGNPLMEYFKHIIFEYIDTLKIERPEKFGGNVEYSNYEELEKDFRNKNLHPLDLKNACKKELEKLIKPVREYFEENEEAKKLYSTVKDLKITR